MITIIADTLSGITPAVAANLGIPYLPQIVIIGNQTYRDDSEIDAETFLEKLRASPVLPKTSAPPPSLYTPIYKKLIEENQTVIVVCPSAEVSGTVRSAEVAAQDFPTADIRIVDTHLIAGGLGSIVYKAIEWAQKGIDTDLLVEKIKEMSLRNRTYIVLDTLEFLLKGGRIGLAKALVGSILQVKPILAFSHGHIEPIESQRTKKRAMSRLHEMILAECPRNPESHFCVMHGGAPVEAQALAKEYSELLGLPEVPVISAPPAILVHSGPGVLAVSFFVE